MSLQEASELLGQQRPSEIELSLGQDYQSDDLSAVFSGLRSHLFLNGERWVTSPLCYRRDVLLVASMAPVLAPIMVAGLALSRVIDGPDALFKQERVGKNGELFTINKIRTLKSGSGDVPSHGAHDPRATPLGNIMRKLAIDELPQMENILEGTLGLFGPRALIQADWDIMEAVLTRSEYDETVHKYSTGGPGVLSRFNLMTHGKPRGDIEEFCKLRAITNNAEYDRRSPVWDMATLTRTISTMGRMAAQVIGVRLPEQPTEP